MALRDFLLAGRWRAQLLLDIPSGRKDYGYWDRDEATFGSERGTVNDPEAGLGIPVGGMPTAEDLAIGRPWEASRDRIVYQEFRSFRGRARGDLYVWELDAYDRPYTTNPVDRLVVVLGQVVLPGAESGGSDPSRIAAQLQVQP